MLLSMSSGDAAKVEREVLVSTEHETRKLVELETRMLV